MLFYRLLQQSVNTDPHPLAELIGGTIRLVSPRGGGTSVHVTMPLDNP